MPRNSPLVWWVVFIAFGLLGFAWLSLQAGPAAPSYPYALFSGGMGSGMLIVLGLATRHWAKGQRAFAKRSAERPRTNRALRGRRLVGDAWPTSWPCSGC